MTKSLLNKNIDNFEIGKVIGSGTFGKVRQGTHLLTGEKVAIKILQKKKIKSQKDIQRIQRQLQILKGISHPNILKLLCVKQTSKQIFIITQLASGSQLYQQITKHCQLSLQTCQKYFIQLYKAIKFLHSHNICHRDIKPENIIVDGQNLKLIDFGLSIQYQKGHQMMNTPCGSPCYAAPQMVLGMPYDSTKVDVWAMGVTLYAMLAGKLPYEHQNIQKLYKLIQNTQFQQIKELPSCVSILLRAMIQRDPKKRINIDLIGQNIWISDQCRSQFTNDQNIVKLNPQIIKEICEVYKKSQKTIMNQLKCSPLSEISTFYYLRQKSKQKQSNPKTNQFQIHDGPFHLQFVFKSYQLLQSYLDRNKINYQWNLPNDEQNTTNINRDQLLINGQIVKIKRIRNLMSMIYVPLGRHLLCGVPFLQKSANLSVNTAKSTKTLNSSRPSFTHQQFCVETF